MAENQNKQTPFDRFKEATQEILKVKKADLKKKEKRKK